MLARSVLYWGVASLLLAPPALSINPEPGRIIVGLSHPLPVGTKFWHGWEIELVEPTLSFIVINAPPEALDSYDTGIRYIAPDSSVKLSSDGADPLASQQWALNASNVTSAWTPASIGSSTRVAVIDSGADITHEDLVPALIVGVNALDGTSDISDECGHGTAVAGILRAARNNGLGISGVWDGPLTVVKVFRPAGTSCAADWSVVASAIRMAVDAGARVISMSFGSAESNPAAEDALQYAADRGVVLVAATGNRGPCRSCVDFPARDPKVIAVSCVTPTFELCRTASSGPEVAIFAPGESILSTAPENTYLSFSGTSFSTPLVAGTLALEMTESPQMTAISLREAVVRGASVSSDARLNAGVLDAGRAVELASSDVAVHSVELSLARTGATACEYHWSFALGQDGYRVATKGTVKWTFLGQDGQERRSETFAVGDLGPSDQFMRAGNLVAGCVGQYQLVVEYVPTDSFIDGGVSNNRMQVSVDGVVPDPTAGAIQRTAERVNGSEPQTTVGDSDADKN